MQSNDIMISTNDMTLSIHTYVKIETGNEIPILRPSVFLNRK